MDTGYVLIPNRILGWSGDMKQESAEDSSVTHKDMVNNVSKGYGFYISVSKVVKTLSNSNDLDDSRVWVAICLRMGEPPPILPSQQLPNIFCIKVAIKMEFVEVGNGFSSDVVSFAKIIEL
jgi:hypothetical protein